MELHQIRAFVAVAEELHFGRAAERLHVAQPPVSRSIQQLERELRVRLFDRSTRRVTLTSAGETLLPRAKEVLRSLDNLASYARSSAGGEVGRVRIAFAGASSNTAIGSLARACKRTYPGIQLELFSQNFAQPLMRKLTSGEVDIALGRWDVIPSSIRTRVIHREHLVVAVPESHRLADRAAVTAAELADESFVSLTAITGSILIERLRKISDLGGFTPNIVQEGPDSWTVMSLVSAEVGCSLTLSSIIDSVGDPHLRFLPLTDHLDPVELRLAWRADSSDPALQAILRVSEATLPTPGY